MVRAAGTSTSITSGTAVGTDLRGNIGVAGYRGSTVSQTDVARSLSLEELKKKRGEYLGGVAITGGIAALLFLGILNGLRVGPDADDARILFFVFLFAAGMAGAAVYFFKTMPSVQEIKDEERRQQELDNKWLCHRCGHIWEP